MNDEHEMILTECQRQMAVLAKSERPPDWRSWDVAAFDERIEHGPEYGCGSWFGSIASHERMRLRRAIDDLERGGLLVTWKRWGRRLSHIKLTPTGEKIAKKLLKQTAK